MRKPEQRLWDRMRRSVGQFINLERIESVVGAGFPDVIGQHRRTVIPIELKVAQTKPHMRLAQINWHLKWSCWGGVSLIVFQRGKELYILPGNLADKLATFAKEDFAAHAVARDWKGLIRIFYENETDGAPK